MLHPHATDATSTPAATDADQIGSRVADVRRELAACDLAAAVVADLADLAATSPNSTAGLAYEHAAGDASEAYADLAARALDVLLDLADALAATEATWRGDAAYIEGAADDLGYDPEDLCQGMATAYIAAADELGSLIRPGTVTR